MKLNECIGDYALIEVARFSQAGLIVPSHGIESTQTCCLRLYPVASLELHLKAARSESQNWRTKREWRVVLERKSLLKRKRNGRL